MEEAKNEDKKPINRRQFIKTGAVLGVVGSAWGTSFLTRNNNSLLQDIVQSSISRRPADFPNLITDKCSRMDQKYTVFCRQLWDTEFVQRMMTVEPSESRKSAHNGWTQLDEALNEAGWAVDHAFASGSENGQPQSPAYAWDNRPRRQKYKFSDPVDAAQKVKKAARFLGADLVGITAYDPLWTYAQLLKELSSEDDHNGPPKFEMIPPDFPFTPKSVIVIALEMDYAAIACSPSEIEGAATGLGYSRMSEVGFSTATFIQALGYHALACGNDVSLSIPYGVAAGLGELGRNGMLVTREFGPRIRLVKVFTELELKTDPPQTFGVADFCRHCGRCAEACPSGAVPTGEKTLVGPTISNNPGVEKWYIDPEKCIQFWAENGSDCTSCITACPYNKPFMWHHQLSTALTALPGAPLHQTMVRLDKMFGFGNTHDLQANADFWKER